MEMCRYQSEYFFRLCIQKRTIDVSESEKVKNTLIEYISTSVLVSPRVYSRVRNEAAEISVTPSFIVSRSERWANWWGSQESVAMLAITRGPSMKPVCAATNSSAVSAASVSTMNQRPSGSPSTLKPSAKRLTSTAFIV